MTDALRLYCRYAGISLRSQMQYRASFLMMTLGQLAATGSEFLGIWALFARFGNLRGWSLAEVGLLYGVINVGFAIAESLGRGFDLFPNMVRTGEFDRVLLRPRGTAFQIAGVELQLMRVGRLLQGSLVLVWSALALHVAWPAWKVALLGGAVGTAVCVFYGLFVLQATLAFWTIETLEIMNTVTYGGTETGQYPLPIYRRWFRLFFTLVVPLACANYLPASAVVGGLRAQAVGPVLPWASVLVGPLFLLVCLRLWRFGVAHYRSTGS